ncbi:MAG: hypothetical protein HWD92_13730 [Flavobacteriia bacterium]|nr:hypothetical protein [Flavobacteriia bacterium]
MLKYILSLSVLLTLSCKSPERSNALLNSINFSEEFRYADSTKAFSVIIPNLKWKPLRMLDSFSPSEENYFKESHSSIVFGYDSLKENLVYVINVGVIQHEDQRSGQNFDPEKEIEYFKKRYNVIEYGTQNLNGKTYILNFVNMIESPEIIMDPESALLTELDMHLYRFEEEKNRAWSLTIAAVRSDGGRSPYNELKADLEDLLPLLESIETE